MQDDTKPSFIIDGTISATLQISLSDAVPIIQAQQPDAISMVIPSSDQVPLMMDALSIYPHITSISDIKIPVPTPPPTPGTGQNFAIGWWLYVNNGPFVPNNTNFGPGWFSYVNSK